MAEYYFLYLLLGAFAGFFAGLFGIGGGIILVPFLAWIFKDQGVAPNQVMLAAVSTSLATILLTSISSVAAHHRIGAIRWETVIRLAPAIFVGALAGTFIADRLIAGYLETIFGCFLIVVAIQMGLKLTPKKQTLTLSGTTGSVAGVFIGALSSVLGIGGGTLTVPFLVKCRFPVQNAVAISSACGFPIAAAGSLGYVLLGTALPERMDNSLGYINGPAFLGIVITSVLFAPMGAKCAHRLPTAHLKRGFAVLVLIVGIRLLLR